MQTMGRRKLLLGMLHGHRLAGRKALVQRLRRREGVMRVWRSRRLPRRKAMLRRLRRCKRVLWMLHCHRLAWGDALLRWRLVTLAWLERLRVGLCKMVTRLEPLRLQGLRRRKVFRSCGLRV